MLLSLSVLALASLIQHSIGAPWNALVPRDGPSTCAQYATISQGPYTLQTNQWGATTGMGSQCSTIDSVTDNSIAWTTTWNWKDNVNSVKSFTNVAGPFMSKPLSQYQSIPTTWQWKYTGDQIRANVAYDLGLGSCPTCNQDYEVMFWLCDYGVIYPLSDNGYPPAPAATPRINGVDWNLILGHNAASGAGNMHVFSFVAQYDVPDFRGDLLNFLRYLQDNYQLDPALYLQKVQAGTEVFNGNNCVLKTTRYTISTT